MSNMPDTSLAHLTTVALNVKLFAILKSLLGRDTPDNDRVYPELVEGLRFRVHLKREIRRVKC
jgi:hypothetical protein